MALPFGLWSAPKVFNTVADMLERIFHRKCIKYSLHYPNYFLFLSNKGIAFLRMLNAELPMVRPPLSCRLAGGVASASFKA